MKTNIKHVVIRPSQVTDEMTDRRHSIELSIRTEDGTLMTNRLQRLLRSYGERLVVPNRLVLEVLDDRNRKSRALKACGRELDDYAESYAMAVELLLDVCATAETLVDKLIETCSDDQLLGELTEELEDFNSVIDDASEFLSEAVGDAEIGCDCDESEN